MTQMCVKTKPPLSLPLHGLDTNVRHQELEESSFLTQICVIKNWKSQVLATTVLDRWWLPGSTCGRIPFPTYLGVAGHPVGGLRGHHPGVPAQLEPRRPQLFRHGEGGPRVAGVVLL